MTLYKLLLDKEGSVVDKDIEQERAEQRAGLHHAAGPEHNVGEGLRNTTGAFRLGCGQRQRLAKPAPGKIREKEK